PIGPAGWVLVGCCCCFWKGRKSRPLKIRPPKIGRVLGLSRNGPAWAAETAARATTATESIILDLAILTSFCRGRATPRVYPIHRPAPVRSTREMRRGVGPARHRPHHP